MKTNLFLIVLLLTAIFVKPVKAENEKRDVPSFSEISLRVCGTLYLTQGTKQSVEIRAKESTLKELITEVKDRKLIVRFPSRNYLRRSFDAGEISIFVTVPEIDRLNISGSGDIVAEKRIESRIIDLNISGSGDIDLNELDAERVQAVISGSGNIILNDGRCTGEMTASISGSGNIKASGFETENVNVKIAGSGNCSVNSNGTITAKIAGSGNVYYSGNPSIESSVAGSGGVHQRK